MKIKRILGFLSDTHVGGQVALFPKNFKTKGGVKITMNKGQEQLYKYWKDACKQFKDCDTFFLLGDLIEGLNKREYGHGLILSDLNEQVNACIQLLKPMVGDKKTLIYTGSGYHGSSDFKCDQNIAEALPNAEFCGAMENRKLKGCNFKINLAHGEGGASLYRATKMDKEALFFKVAESCNKLEAPNLVVRGHLHFYTYLENEQMSYLQLPCWKAFEISKIYLKNIGRLQPDIGGCKVYVFEDNSMMIKPCLYPTPHITDAYSEC